MHVGTAGNKERSKYFIAIVIGDLQRLGLKCARSELETAVKLGDCGMLNDNRYF